MVLTVKNTGALVEGAGPGSESLRVQLTRPTYIRGVSKKIGDIVELSRLDAAYLVAINKATFNIVEPRRKKASKSVSD